MFTTRWNSGMRAQLTSVADRLGAVAKDLRAQAEAQRTASAGDTSIAASPGGGSGTRTSLQQELAEMRRMRAEQMMRLARANSWAEEHGRQQIRQLADASEAEQREWWDRLTDDQRAALLRNDPGALFGLEGLPADVRAEARADYIDSVRSDLEISSTQDQAHGGTEHRLGPPRRRGQRRHRRAGGRHLPGRPRPRRGDRRQPRQQGRQGPRRDRRAASPRATSSTRWPRPRRSSTGCTRS